MRAYLKVVNLLRDELESYEDVNTVIHLARSESDLFKKNIYPLVAINPQSASFNGPVNEFTFEIAVMDVRDISDDETLDKFKGNDDQIWNLNTCHAVLNKLVTFLRLRDNEDGIEITGISNLTPIILDTVGYLDGWVLTIVVQIPDDTDACE